MIMLLKYHQMIKSIFVLLLLTALTACGGGSNNSSSSSSSSSASSGGYLVTTFAGATTSGSVDGSGTTARFSRPRGIASDGTNLFVTDSVNNIIRKIVIATGEVTTLAGTAGSSGSNDGTGTAARFYFPSGITIDGANLFVVDSHNSIIRKIVIATGEVTTIAGTAGAKGSSNGTGAAARFNLPEGIASDGTNLFVADTDNSTIRKIVIATGVVTTLAGTAGSNDGTDGTGAAARFSLPAAIIKVGANLFVADSGNGTVRKIVITSGVVTTIAGSSYDFGSNDGTGQTARFSSPKGITSDGTNLFVVDRHRNNIRKIVIASGVVTTIAGTAGVSGSTDGRGAAARFYMPEGITTDGTNLFVADSMNHAIRKIELVPGSSSSSSVLASSSAANSSAPPTNNSSSSAVTSSNSSSSSALASSSSSSTTSLLGGTIQGRALNPTAVTTFAGDTSGTGGSSDGTGTAARFSSPCCITTDGTNLFVTDRTNHTIRKIVIATGVVTTLAGTAGVSGSNDGTGAAAQFSYPRGITTDGTNLFVTDTLNHNIRKIVIATGVVTTLAGTAGVTGNSDGTGAAAQFDYPRGITTDGTNLFITDTLNHTIRKIVISTGVVTTIAGTAGVTGISDGTSTAARFNNPIGITTDGTNLFVGDTSNYTIRKIVIATGVVTTLAGTAGVNSSTDGTGTNASFGAPYGITIDGTNLFVADGDNHTIRKIVIATGVVTTLAGQANTFGNTDGALVNARFHDPYGITTDGTSLFVTDSSNNSIRKIE